MKLKDLINKLDDRDIIFINGKQHGGNLSEDMLEMEVTKINIETRKASRNDLESLGYSFEVGV
ncbi:MAG: hypothetical protein WCX96_05170 [Bacilli bacterium]